MSLRIEQLKSFLGFGDKTKRGEYYFSQGMRLKKGGIEPGWGIVSDANSSTAGVIGMDLITFFTERLEGTTPYIYGVDNVTGDIFKASEVTFTWARLHTPGTTTHGNGLITDHSSSQRVLYIQDEYVGSWDGTVWYDTFMDLGWSANVPKDADIYEDWVVIANSSTVALLNITDDSKNYQAFNFPADFVIRSVKSGRNGVLLGANFNNRGVLALWDCQSDRSIAPWIWFDSKIYGVAKYQGNWIVSTGRELVLTNGYNILRTYDFPDLVQGDYNFGPTFPSGMFVEEDKLFLTSEIGLPNRKKTGVWILDLITSLWEFCPNSLWDIGENTGMGALFRSSRNSRYVSYNSGGIVVPVREHIGRIHDSTNSSYFIMEVGGKDDHFKKAEGIVLNFNFSVEDYYVYTSPDWRISAKLYNFKRQLWCYGQASSTSASAWSIPVNGTVASYNNAKVGDEITVVEGLNAGAIRHISEIDREGLANELWTLDEPLVNVIEANAYVHINPFKKVGEKTITTQEIKDSRIFIPVKTTQTGRRFLLKIVLETAYMRPHIKGVSFIYNDLGT